MTRHRTIVALLALGIVAVTGRAQSPPTTADQSFPPLATPVKWKWEKLDSNSYFYWSARRDRPVILAVPNAFSRDEEGFTGYLERYFDDENYALGILDWRGAISYQAVPTALIAKAFGDLARARGKASKRFDPNRIVIYGADAGAFLALNLASDRKRLAAAGIPPDSICATILIQPKNLDVGDLDSYIAKQQFAREPSASSNADPLAHAASAPPTLMLYETTDLDERRKVAKWAAQLRGAGRTVVEAEYPQFVEKAERTYLGWPEGQATKIIGKFLRTHCPPRVN